MPFSTRGMHSLVIAKVTKETTRGIGGLLCEGSAVPLMDCVGLAVTVLNSCAGSLEVLLVIGMHPPGGSWECNGIPLPKHKGECSEPRGVTGTSAQSGVSCCLVFPMVLLTILLNACSVCLLGNRNGTIVVTNVNCVLSCLTAIVF